jgi:hypothetical protein
VIEVNRDTADRKQIEDDEQQLSFLAAIVQSSDDAIATKISTALSQAGTKVPRASSATLPRRQLVSRSQLSSRKTGRMKSVRY